MENKEERWKVVLELGGMLRCQPSHVEVLTDPTVIAFPGSEP